MGLFYNASVKGLIYRVEARLAVAKSIATEVESTKYNVTVVARCR